MALKKFYPCTKGFTRSMHACIIVTILVIDRLFPHLAWCSLLVIANFNASNLIKV